MEAEAAARLDNSVLDELDSLHRQCKAQARKQDAFDTDTPINWLTWEECQTSRVIAETKCLQAGSAPSLDMLHDVCLLTILTYQPPDRVGLMRTLQLGGSLKHITTGGFQLDITVPTAHKTAVYFGPTRTTLPAAICNSLSSYIDAAQLQGGHYIFYAGEDASQPLAPYAWTRLVKSCFQRHSTRAVPLPPKELRAAFITWLKEGEHADATLKAAARPCGTRARRKHPALTTRASTTRSSPQPCGWRRRTHNAFRRQQHPATEHTAHSMLNTHS